MDLTNINFEGRERAKKDEDTVRDVFELVCERLQESREENRGEKVVDGYFVNSGTRNFG